MIRHLLFKQPESLRALSKGDWIASFTAHVGSLDAEPLKECPYIGDTFDWQATPDNAGRILKILAEHLRVRFPDLVLIVNSEHFQGAIYFKETDGAEYIFAYRSDEVTEDIRLGLLEMAGEIEKTNDLFRRRGWALFDPLQGLEAAEVWNLGKEPV